MTAGPLYQGVSELIGLETDREGIATAAAGIDPPPRPSAWWWLLPPVMPILEQRRMSAYRRQAFGELSEVQRAQYTGFRQKWAGWFTVATGAALLATKETWELREEAEWSSTVFTVVLIIMFALSVTPTIIALYRHAPRD